MNGYSQKTETKTAKYNIILYLVEHKGLTIQEIVDLDPETAFRLLPNNDPIIMSQLQIHVSRNYKTIKKWNILFPGRLGKSSNDTIIMGLHVHMKNIGRSLRELGLSIRGVRIEANSTRVVLPTKPEEVIDWCRNIIGRN